jgi:hypothetical protein
MAQDIRSFDASVIDEGMTRYRVELASPSGRESRLDIHARTPLPEEIRFGERSNIRFTLDEDGHRLNPNQREEAAQRFRQEAEKRFPEGTRITAEQNQIDARRTNFAVEFPAGHTPDAADVRAVVESAHGAGIVSDAGRLGAIDHELRQNPQRLFAPGQNGARHLARIQEGAGGNQLVFNAELTRLSRGTELVIEPRPDGSHVIRPVEASPSMSGIQSAEEIRNHLNAAGIRTETPFPAPEGADVTTRLERGHGVVSVPPGASSQEILGAMGRPQTLPNKTVVNPPIIAPEAARIAAEQPGFGTPDLRGHSVAAEVGGRAAGTGAHAPTPEGHAPRGRRIGGGVFGIALGAGIAGVSQFIATGSAQAAVTAARDAAGGTVVDGVREGNYGRAARDTVELLDPTGVVGGLRAIRENRNPDLQMEHQQAARGNVGRHMVRRIEGFDDPAPGAAPGSAPPQNRTPEEPARGMDSNVLAQAQSAVAGMETPVACHGTPDGSQFSPAACPRTLEPAQSVGRG